jgi:hypothetical protein
MSFIRITRVKEEGGNYETPQVQEPIVALAKAHILVVERCTYHPANWISSSCHSLREAIKARPTTH